MVLLITTKHPHQSGWNLKTFRLMELDIMLAWLIIQNDIFAYS